MRAILDKYIADYPDPAQPPPQRQSIDCELSFHPGCACWRRNRTTPAQVLFSNHNRIYSGIPQKTIYLDRLRVQELHIEHLRCAVINYTQAARAVSLHMRCGIHGGKLIPRQPCHNVATIIKHPEANKQAGRIPLNHKHILTARPENHMRELVDNRYLLPK